MPNLRASRLDATETEPASDGARNLAVGCHLLGFAGLVFPFGHVAAPLLLWLFQRHAHVFVDAHGREAVNFQISFSVWLAVIGALAVLLFWTVIVPLLAVLATAVLLLVWLVVVISAALAASRGQTYQYPLTRRLIS